MSTFKHSGSLIGLGLFWGLSPSLYKFLGEAGVPIAQIIVISGAGVGLGLYALQVSQNGRSGLGRRVWMYGGVCALLLNVAFAASLYFAVRLPITTYAMIVSTTPFMTYALALLLGRDRLRNWRILALLTGLIGALVAILSRHGPGGDYATPLAFACFSLPLLYAVYNNFTAAWWPRDAGTLTVGIAESLASAGVALPFLLWPGQLVAPGRHRLRLCLGGFRDCHVGRRAHRVLLAHQERGASINHAGGIHLDPGCGSDWARAVFRRAEPVARRQPGAGDDRPVVRQPSQSSFRHGVSAQATPNQPMTAP